MFKRREDVQICKHAGFPKGAVSDYGSKQGTEKQFYLQPVWHGGAGGGSADPQHGGNCGAQGKNKQELRIISSDLAAQSCAGTMGAPPPRYPPLLLD